MIHCVTFVIELVVKYTNVIKVVEWKENVDKKYCDDIIVRKHLSPYLMLVARKKR